MGGRTERWRKPIGSFYVCRRTLREQNKHKRTGLRALVQKEQRKEVWMDTSSV